MVGHMSKVVSKISNMRRCHKEIDKDVAMQMEAETSTELSQANQVQEPLEAGRGKEETPSSQHWEHGLHTGRLWTTAFQSSERKCFLLL